MLDYGYNFMQTKIHVDNESAICVIKNPFYHSKTKHTKIRHHFIRESYEKRLIEMVKIHTDNNDVDLLTKAFDVGDEAVHKELGDRMERAATTASSLEAEQDSGEWQIQALVDKKKVIIIETSVKSDLHLEDADGTECLPTATIFKQMTLMGAKTTAWNEFSSTMASAIIEENDQDMFDTSILDDEEVVAKKEVITADPVPTAGEVVTTAGVKVSTAAITSQISMDEITFAKDLIDIKTSKPKTKGIVMQEPNATKKHFVALRANEKRSKPPAQSQKRKIISTYLKNMARYKYNQLKTKSFKDIQMLFNKEMKRVNTFVYMDTELVKGSEKEAEGGSKRAGGKLEQEDAR
uniref:Putative ribonuclease H-like domain-containing protein n=1 Tax=Tanacetum cinerariifolium TaxID=118510 RepID=A0A6L2MS64_TANCI|nr:putative ribonuclease H-like domain-containing protein [Tanacetum cinerariifolium]